MEPVFFRESHCAAVTQKGLLFSNNAVFELKTTKRQRRDPQKKCIFEKSRLVPKQPKAPFNPNQILNLSKSLKNPREHLFISQKTARNFQKSGTGPLGTLTSRLLL